MMETYQGTLRDNRIEWSGDTPKHLTPDQAVRVHVTILDEVKPSVPEQGRRMAAALERLAAGGALPGVPDPMSWEREAREDRPLPGRDGR